MRKTYLILLNASEFPHKAIEGVLTWDGRPVGCEDIVAEETKCNKTGECDREVVERGGWGYVGDIGAPHGIHLFALMHLKESVSVPGRDSPNASKKRVVLYRVAIVASHLGIPPAVGR